MEKEGASHIAGLTGSREESPITFTQGATNRPASRHDKDSGRENPCQVCGPVAHCRETNGALETYGRFMEGAVVAALREKPTRGAVTTGHDVLLRPVRTLLYAALSTGSGMLDSHSLAIDASM